ncbi:hypothetical protein U1Q18_001010 [Sarracenia purpurea var. burkii]
MLGSVVHRPTHLSVHGGTPVATPFFSAEVVHQRLTSAPLLVVYYILSPPLGLPIVTTRGPLGLTKRRFDLFLLLYRSERSLKRNSSPTMVQTQRSLCSWRSRLKSVMYLKAQHNLCRSLSSAATSTNYLRFQTRLNWEIKIEIEIFAEVFVSIHSIRRSWKVWRVGLTELGGSYCAPLRMGFPIKSPKHVTEL